MYFFFFFLSIIASVELPCLPVAPVTRSIGAMTVENEGREDQTEYLSCALYWAVFYTRS